ncbi:hypothetical protein [Planctobacterium marinum]
MAFKQIADKRFRLQQVPFVSEQQVIAEIVKRNHVDLYWLGADKDLENDLTAIPVPTTMGLIGFRKFIIHKKDAHTFSALQDIKQLRKHVACQGRYWPDTKILNHAGLRVTSSVFYEDLFKMLAAGRCDYFPRGIHDHRKELQLRKAHYPDLISFESVLLRYPFAVYFYTSKENIQLASLLETSLRRLAQSGDIRRLMQEHELTRDVFPLQQSSDTRILGIQNPFLPTNADTDDPQLWLQPADFGINTTIKTTN